MVVGSSTPSGLGRIRGSFSVLLALAVALGLVIRIVFVTLVNLPALPGDAKFFRQVASNVINGKGYSFPFPSHPDKLVASALHPPLFPAVLAVFDLLGLDSIGAQRIALACVTSGAVLVVGLLGRKVGGPMVGVVAAFIAAVNPLWLSLTGSLMSESVYLIVIALMLLSALRCTERPSIGRFAILGVVIALAVLIRSEAIDFVVLLGVPVLLVVVVPWKMRAVLAVSMLVGVLVLVGPWLLRNEIRVGAAVLSTQQGGTLAGSYCTDSFNPASPTYGAFSGSCATALGAFIITYEKPPDRKTGWTEASLSSALTSDAEKYARGHLGQMPRVIAAREAATWDLDYSNDLTVAAEEGRNATVEQISFVLFWVLAPFVVVGAIVLARSSWRRLVVILAPVLVVVINVGLTYGSTRFRMAAEPSLTVLAAMGLTAVVHRFRSGFRREVTPQSAPVADLSNTVS